jgi:MIP family channel proteins
MDRLLRPCIAELIGVFIFIFIGAGAICTDYFLTSSLKPGIGLLGIALAHGLTMAIVVSATMNISGGHINPAVTIALLFLGKIEAKRALFYIIAQLIGAIFAGFFLSLIFSGTKVVTSEVGLGTPHASSIAILLNRDLDYQLIALTTLIEMILTFILLFAYFGTVVDPRAPKIGGFGVGLAITVAMLMGSPLTGAAMNPARYFGTGLGEAIIRADFARLSDFYIYLIGPILGAVLAAWIYSSWITEPGTTAENQ